MALAILAAIKTDLGSHELAARLWGAVEAFRRDRGIIALPAMTLLAAASQPGIREALGEEGYEQAWAEGMVMSLEEAVRYASRGRGARRRPAFGWSSLTPTEREVVKLVADGLSNPEIAERMFVSRRTVTTHLTNIFRKLDLSSRAELTAAAVRRPPSRRS
jgi:DNA-binding CsgD family transcriptional regulator